MKYCIVVLAHKNHLLLEKTLFQLLKYSTPGIKKYLLLNNPTPEVQLIANKYKKSFAQYLFLGENNPAKAIDAFISENIYDFYFKVDDDVLVATEMWDKKLLISWLNNLQTNPIFISCLIPINGVGWTECVKKMGVEKEFHRLFPFYGLDSNVFAGAIWLDRRLALWLWQKVLELGLKTEKKILRGKIKYSIGLIGFERKLWQEMGKFYPDDEVRLYEYQLSNKREYIIDESVIAHHFSFFIYFDYLMENIYPDLKDREF